ncbi:MAG: VOC family protein [Balneolaceae bacterium]|nr:VOC family protein [Balneolaceae bacterium]
MFNAVFDHYTIKVQSLDRSIEFYKNILGLEEIENRTKKPYIRWLSMGPGSELHIVEGDPKTIKTDVGVHMSVRLRDFDRFMEHLEKNGITPHTSGGEPNEITIRTDGIRQVYFTDPDGYWIEVNEAEILNDPPSNN